MKKPKVFIPPSVQTAAEGILQRKAYEVYPFAVDDGTRYLFPVDSDTELIRDPANPSFMPGHKICLDYNKNPEIYVVLAAVYAPSPAGSMASSSVEKLTDTLNITALAATNDVDTAASSSKILTTSDKSQTVVDKYNRDGPMNFASAPKFLYLVLPLLKAGADKIKPTADLTTTKLIAQTHVLSPPKYAEGRILHIPIIKKETKIMLPVEIKSVQRGMGLKNVAASLIGSGNGQQVAPGGMKAPEEDTWKYKLMYSNEWLSEETVVDLVEGEFESVATWRDREDKREIVRQMIAQ